jgi:transporter family protein
MWKYYAILSAVFAALTAIFAKIGIAGVNSSLATAIRTVVILLITWGIVLFSGTASGMKELSRNNWTFLILSGVATGLSWLFYFKALQTGDASKVAPIDKLSVVFTILLAFLILREPVSWKVLLGGCLIVAGGIVILLDK